MSSDYYDCEMGGHGRTKKSASTPCIKGKIVQAKKEGSGSLKDLELFEVTSRKGMLDGEISTRGKKTRKRKRPRCKD